MSESNKPTDSYTIVIFRGSTAKPLRFSFPRAIVLRTLILGVCLILADLALLSHYVIRTGEVWELQALRGEMLSAREQTAAFSTAVDDLKRRLLTMLREQEGREPSPSPSAAIVDTQSVKTTEKGGRAATMPPRRSRAGSGTSRSTPRACCSA